MPIDAYAHVNVRMYSIAVGDSTRWKKQQWSRTYRSRPEAFLRVRSSVETDVASLASPVRRCRASPRMTVEKRRSANVQIWTGDLLLGFHHGR